MDLETPTPSSVSSPLTEPDEPEEYHDKKRKSPQVHMRSIIEQQFDLEILLKHRELGTIEDRISQVQTLMVQMRKLHHNTREAVSGEPRDFVQRYAHYLKDKETAPVEASSVANGATAHHIVDDATHTNNVNTHPLLQGLEPPTRRIRHPTAKLASNGGYIGRGNAMPCIYRRPDGVLVRLVCQDCDRSNFGSTQGFINHCRISHARDYGSHDSAAIACGVEIEEQDGKGRQALKQLGRDVKSKPVLRDRSFSMSAVSGRAMTQVQLQQLQQQQNQQKAKQLPTQPITHRGFAPAVSTLPPPPTKFIPPPKVTTFDNLEQLLIERKVAQDVDFKLLVKTSMESVPKSHLFEGESESDEEEQAELGEDATPFQRVIAEARKLKLNVDELIAQGKANGNRPSGYKPARRSSGFTKNRKKSGAAAASAAASAAAAATAATAEPVTKEPASSRTPQKPARTASPIGSPSLRPSFGGSHSSSNDDVQEMKLAEAPAKKPQARRISISTPSTRSSTRAASCRAQQNEEEEGSHIVGQLSKFLSLDRFF
ncbi:Protein AHC1 [Yarrowia sp. E02]|nr:Protein AHC1 [Yarrowia sp. E02]